jgi:hypothetical protein
VCGTTYELFVGGHGRSALRSESGGKLSGSEVEGVSCEKRGELDIHHCGLLVDVVVCKRTFSECKLTPGRGTHGDEFRMNHRMTGSVGSSFTRVHGKGVMQTTSPRSSKKLAPNACAWHHADAEQASSEEDTFHEHLPHQGPRGHRRF